jgi:hypothetical protein
MAKLKTHGIDPNIARLLNNIDERVRKDWGPAFDHLGVRLQSALLAESLLILSSQQDESVDPARVVQIIKEGWTWIIEETNR